MRNPETGISKGYGFVSYDNFESSDNALTAMNGTTSLTLTIGQFFGNKIISVQYAFKKDSKGERHGSQAERLLAANRPMASKQLLAQGFMPTDMRFPPPPQMMYQGMPPMQPMGMGFPPMGFP